MAIVYFHGLFATPGFWLPCIKSEFNFSHVFIDYEPSNFVQETDRFLLNIANTLNNFLRTYAYEKVYFFGHSLGARIAQLIPFDIPKMYFAPVIHTSSPKSHSAYLSCFFSANSKSTGDEGLVEKVFTRQHFSFDIDTLDYDDLVFQPTSDILTDLIMLPSDNVLLYQGDHFTLPDNKIVFEHVKY